MFNFINNHFIYPNISRNTVNFQKIEYGRVRKLVKKNYLWMSKSPENSSIYLTEFETKSGIQIKDFKVSFGESPSWGSFLKVRYSVYIAKDLKIIKIDSTFDRQETFLYQHGTGEINLAFEEAIHSMKIGGKRRIVIKSFTIEDVLNAGPISPSSGIRRELKLLFKDKNPSCRLVYDIELIEIIPKEFF